MKPLPAKDFDKTAYERFGKTLTFLEGVVEKTESILDLGPDNAMSAMMAEKGYKVKNTGMVDLDIDYSVVREANDVITAFQILEHMVSPFPLLHEANARKLVASVPLSLWFSGAYWNKKDPFDRHYHEFEPRQFHMLIEKAGWEIKKSEKWNLYRLDKLGIRPLLRRFTPRYYIVYCERRRK